MQGSLISPTDSLEKAYAGPPPPSPPASVDRTHEDSLKDITTPSRILISGAGKETLLLERKPSPSPRRYTSTMVASSSALIQDPSVPKSSRDFLHPSSITSRHERHARRNTTGSTPRPLHHVKHGSQPFVFEDIDIDSELATDIRLHAAQIRKERQERQSKRAKAEAALTNAEEHTPPVGNVIGEGHVNYVLMYNMLTGIRIGVSRCQAKIKRPLTEEDFTARHKYSFDIVGNELTPSAKYDFKFKDYAPWVFRELREDVFHLDPADYLVSLTAQYILSELGSPGKSGSFFYFSRDYRFIIKTIRHSEHKFLRKILRHYHAYVWNNPHTLLSRFYGLHRVKLPRGQKIHFVIMNNLFPLHKDIHETYDLKGSTVGRLYPEDKLVQNPRAVMKDLNWINRRKTLQLGPEKRTLLTEQVRRDSEWLMSVNVMDYSLLVGIHNMERGNKDNVRRNTLKVFSPDVPRVRRTPMQIKGAKSPDAIAMRRAIGSGRSATSPPTLPDDDSGTLDRQHFLFYKDEGGLRATGEENEDLHTIYYLGIIDILTPYTIVKKLEHILKGVGAHRHKISAVAPAEYSGRFFSFMKAIMQGEVGSPRRKAW